MAAEMENLVPCEDSVNQTLLFKWEPEFALGIPIIDAQHQGMIMVINSLQYAVMYKFEKNILESIIGLIQEYSRVHFTTEESIFKSCGFPDAKHHIEQHRKLAVRIIETGQESLFFENPEPFLLFLKEWLTNHVLNEDHKYRDFILQNQSTKR